MRNLHKVFKKIGDNRDMKIIKSLLLSLIMLTSSAMADTLPEGFSASDVTVHKMSHENHPATVEEDEDSGDAKPAIIKSSFDGIKTGDCVNTQPLGYFITQKVDDHHYVMKSTLGYTNFVEPRALLETKKAIYDGKGYPTSIRVKKIGSKVMTSDNGFSATYWLLRECGYDDSISCSRMGPPQASWARCLKKAKAN